MLLNIIRYSLFFIVTFFVIQLSSCRKDLDFKPYTTNLQFSNDSVLLDTIFNQSQSETYLLKVYNQDEDAIIPNIYLNSKSSSMFRINVDGMSGFEFEQVPIRKKDSLMIFISLVANSNQELLYEDEIVFSNGNSRQEVKLLAMLENAKYYYPKDGENSHELTGESVWDNSVSRVIFGNLIVKNDLTINKGTKIYFHKNADIEIDENQTLNILGTNEQPVLFRGDRSDPRYDSLPKQWKGLKINKNAKLIARNTQFRNAESGIIMEDNSEASLENIEVYNMSYSGIHAKNAKIIGKNIVVSNAGSAGLNLENGGDYKFYFSSIANMWESNVGETAGIYLPLYMSNYIKDKDGNVSTKPLNSLFANCIFYGRYPNGVYLDANDGSEFSFMFKNSLIKNENKKELNLDNESVFKSIITDNPLFISTFFNQQNLSLQEDSPAKDKGDSSYNSIVPKDFLGKTRDNTPNMGAFE